MQVRHVSIQRFRGILKCEWSVVGQFICLIGACDSTKSTLIEAIDFALSSRWAIPFDDSDFYNGKTTDPIVIQVTAGALPPELLREQTFSRQSRGWDRVNGTLHDEPESQDELVLTIQLSVNESLEPKWSVITDRQPEGVPISARERELFGCVRIESYIDRQLTWSRGSALPRITQKDGTIAALLADVVRSARTALDAKQPPTLAETGKRVTKAARDLGVKSRNDYTAQIDGRAVDLGSSGLALHDGAVPLRLTGLSRAE